MNLSNFVAYVKQAWKNKPDTSTPLSAERLTHQEEGIKGNNGAIQELAAAVVSQIVNNPDKIASMAALYAVNQKVTTLDGKVGDTAQLPSGTADVASAIAQLYSNLDSINTKLRFIKNFNNPNAELKLTQYAYCNYVSIGNTSGYGYATIYGMYDNNNGNAISGQMAITSSGEVLKRSYKNGAWTTWKNVDDYDTNLKRMPLDGTVEFNQFTITKNTSGKYVLNFYKNTAKIASIVSA